jgi:hypothetical protein
MRKARVGIFGLIFIVSISAFSSAGGPAAVHDTVVPTTVVNGAPAAVSPAYETPAWAAYGKLPFLFVPNAGQMDAKVRYSGRGPGYAVYFTPEEAVFVFLQQAPRSTTATP